MGAAARLRDRPDHPRPVLRRAPGRSRLAYPALQRLAKKGWVTAKWGQTDANQRAKFYRLTPEGKKQLLREESRWTQLVNAIGRVMKPGAGARTEE